MLDRMLSEATRQLTVCNACRYCEGYCPVFPALERRVSLNGEDALYLAHLCHDCRACLDACPYAPPHEYNINLPAILSEVRATTYETAPLGDSVGRLLGRGLLREGLVTTLAAVTLFALGVWQSGQAAIFNRHIGPGAFYEVIPWAFMAIIGMILATFVLLVMGIAGLILLRGLSVPVGRGNRWKAAILALADAAILREMQGGGDGCHYPDERPSNLRRRLHIAVASGFIAAFASTAAAAFYQEVLGMLPPYPPLSVPVVLGAAGGVAMTIGCGCLLYLKLRTTSGRTTATMYRLDVAFLVSLSLASLSGLALLPLRETALMGSVLILHLATIATLYLTAPYTKFAHATFRLAALLRNRIEGANDLMVDARNTNSASPEKD